MPPSYNRLVTPLLTGLAPVALTSSSLRTPLCAFSTLSLSIRLSLPHRFHQSAPIHLHHICISSPQTLVDGWELLRIPRRSIQLDHCDSAYSNLAKKKRPSGP